MFSADTRITFVSTRCTDFGLKIDGKGVQED